jgi:CheY-like chemotaxis protein
VPRILVVEDEPLISMLMVDWLRELGHETVGPAHSVTDALALASDAALDAALVDISIGREDCKPVVDALSVRGIPFALATGSNHRDLTARFGDTPVLAKPFDYEALKSTLGKLLNGGG